MKQIIKWQTKDGKEFDTVEQAEFHEMILELISHLDNVMSYVGETDLEEIARIILSKYTLTPI